MVGSKPGTQYYVLIGSTHYWEKVKSVETEKKLSRMTGKFTAEGVDRNNALYNVITSGDEFEVYRTSDDLKLFGGYIEKIKRVEKGKYRLRVDGGDYTTKLNQILVRAQIYEDREYSVIVRDLMNNYIMNTDLIDNCDATTGWTASGDFSNLTTDTASDADGHSYARLGTACLKVDCTYSTGIGTLSKTISSIDLASTDYICKYLWIEDTANLGTNLKLRIGQDSSNYFEMTIASSTLSDGWNYLEFDLNGASQVGSPTVANCTYYVLNVDIESGVSGINLRFDDIRRTPHTNADFTVSNVTTTTYYTDIQFKNNTVFESIKKIAEIRPTKYDFYIDISKVLNFAIMGSTDSGVDLIKGTNIFGEDFWDNDSNLCNFVTIYGGRQLFTNIQSFDGDGSETTFTLTYRPIDTEVVVDGSIQIGYIAGMAETYDYTKNYEEKQVIFEAGSIPGAGSGNVVITYSYSIPIIVQKGDDDSISNYQKREKKIENPHITTRADAITIASDYIEKWKDPIVNGKVICKIQPTIDVGETVDITNSKFFSSTQTMTVVGLKHFLIGTKIRTELTLTERTKDVEEYLKELYERINALEEKEKGESELVARLASFLDDLGLTDDPSSNLVAQLRTVNTNAWYFGNRAACAFNKPIQLLGGSGKYGTNQISNPSS